MDVNQLRSVVVLAEEASFSRAARRLGVAQPSLSQLIKKLESDSRCRLFDRLPKRVVPTQAGERLLSQARLILAHVADAERLLGEASGEVAGAVSIGAIPTIAPFLLARVLGELSRRHPAVRPTVVEDVTERLVGMVERGELDVAIVSSVPHPPRTVHVEPVATEGLVLMVSTTHELARRSKRGTSWEELSRERVLVLPDVHCLSGQVSRVCRLHGLKTPMVMRGAQLSTVAAVVTAGLGVSLVPEMMRGSVGRGCVLVPIASDPPTREIAVAWSLVRYRTNASRAVAEIAQGVAAPRPPKRQRRPQSLEK